MKKKVYVSADWKEPFDSHSWDKEVVDRIRKWKDDDRYGINIVCTDDVHDSVINNDDCRRCEIKKECETQIEKSDIIIFVVGDKTSTKRAGACDGMECSPAYSNERKKYCKTFNSNTEWKNMSYLEDEITAAVSSRKSIILVYNSMYKQETWIPSWYKALVNKYQVCELCRIPFWKDAFHSRDCYQDIKQYLF